METFEEVLEQYRPMIYHVVKRAKVYKNHEYYRHCAMIALWEAWRKYDASCGPFSPYAYRTMLTTVYKEMSRENHYAQHYTSIDKDTLTFLAHQMQLKNNQPPSSEIFTELVELMKKEELELLMDLYCHRYKYDELVQKYGISAAAIKKRRDRLVKKLRERFG